MPRCGGEEPRSCGCDDNAHSFFERSAPPPTCRDERNTSERLSNDDLKRRAWRAAGLRRVPVCCSPDLKRGECVLQHRAQKRARRGCSAATLSAHTRTPSRHQLLTMALRLANKASKAATTSRVSCFAFGGGCCACWCCCSLSLRAHDRDWRGSGPRTRPTPRAARAASAGSESLAARREQMGRESTHASLAPSRPHPPPPPTRNTRSLSQTHAALVGARRGPPHRCVSWMREGGGAGASTARASCLIAQILARTPGALARNPTGRRWVSISARARRRFAAGSGS